MKKRISLLMVVIMIMVSMFTVPVGFADAQTNAASTVTILSFNDFHGALAEDSKNLGMAKLVGYVKERMKANPNTLVVSGGDNYQGTAMSNLTYGEPVNAMFKQMGLTASAVGNHEFDWGSGNFEKWQSQGGFTFLAANIIDKKTKTTVKWAKPYMVIDKGGMKIALVGLSTTDTPTSTKAENVANVQFADPIATGKKYVELLKSGKAPEGKVDVVIALCHMDSEMIGDGVPSGTAVDLLRKEAGFDGVISAHSHKSVASSVNGAPIVQAYYNGRNIAEINIEKNAEGKITLKGAVSELYKTKDKLTEDADTKAVYKSYEDKLGPILKEVIGKATAEFAHDKDKSVNVSVLGQFTSDIMRQKTGSQIAIQNGGGLRTGLPAGDVTVGKLYEIMPFDNTLVKMELKGSDLIKAIEHGIEAPDMGDGQFAGLHVVYDASKPYESKIVSIVLENGDKIDANKYYTVVTNDFMITGGDKYNFKNAKNIVNTNVPIRDMLIDYIRASKEITPKPVTAIWEVKEYDKVKADVIKMEQQKKKSEVKPAAVKTPATTKPAPKK